MTAKSPRPEPEAPAKIGPGQCFTTNIVAFGQSSRDLCACGSQRRVHGFDCETCHALAQTIYRARVKERHRQAHNTELAAISHRYGARQ